MNGAALGYKVVMVYSSGEEEDDEVFETEAEAEAYGLVQVSTYQAGGEVLNLSNPGDYPLDPDDEAEFKIIEIDD